MHPSVESLLSLRDGELVDATVSQHVSQCTQCSSELESYRQIRVSLNELPEVTPSDGIFGEVLGRVNPTRGRHDWLKLAVAASVIALLSITLLQYINKEDGLPDMAGLDSTVAPAAIKQPLGELMAESARLEETLERVSFGGGRDVMDARTADTIVALEDRLALVDYHLSHNSGLSRQQIQSLWRARVQLMDSLVSVRYAQFRNTSY